MREIIEAMQAKMRETGEPVAYCTGGHGHTWVDASEVVRKEDGTFADAHGACPGPVIVMEPNPDAVVEVVPGGVEREPPPCARCFQPTTLFFDDEVGTVEVAKGAPGGTYPQEEFSFTLQAVDDDGNLIGDPMTICSRCLAGALASGQRFALLELRGRTVPWRR